MQPFGAADGQGKERPHDQGRGRVEARALFQRRIRVVQSSLQLGVNLPRQHEGNDFVSVPRKQEFLGFHHARREARDEGDRSHQGWLIVGGLQQGKNTLDASEAPHCVLEPVAGDDGVSRAVDGNGRDPAALDGGAPRSAKLWKGISVGARLTGAQDATREQEGEPWRRLLASSPAKLFSLGEGGHLPPYSSHEATFESSRWEVDATRRLSTEFHWPAQRPPPPGGEARRGLSRSGETRDSWPSLGRRVATPRRTSPVPTPGPEDPALDLRDPHSPCCRSGLHSPKAPGLASPVRDPPYCRPETGSHPRCGIPRALVLGG
eukprot:scaffold1282_cov251-Pinguiococcus_pyrenoidosus.AAC.70